MGNIKYFLTNSTYENAITGISKNWLHAVEINKKQSFKNDNEKKYFYDVIENAWKINNGFCKFDNDKISEITFFPKFKKIKQIDIIRQSPVQIGLNFIISKRTLDILKSFKLPECNIIPVKIDTFCDDYFLIGFSAIEPSTIDFSKSVFSDNEKNFKFNSFEEWDEINYSKKSPVELFLGNIYGYDIINIRMVDGLYFSEKLVETLEDNKIIGFKINKERLLMNKR